MLIATILENRYYEGCWDQVRGPADGKRASEADWRRPLLELIGTPGLLL